MHRFANALSDLTKFAKKVYRDGFMQTQVRGGIAYQIQALRQKFGLTQTEFADKTGKTQSVVSRLENTEYGKVSVQTLLDIASANDVALVVRFVSYPEFLAQTADMSPNALMPDTIFESIESQQTERFALGYKGGLVRAQAAIVRHNYWKMPAPTDYGAPIKKGQIDPLAAIRPTENSPSNQPQLH